MTASLTRNLIWRDATLAGVDETASDVQDVYFIGYPSHLFKSYAPLIAHAQGQRLAAVVSD